MRSLFLRIFVFFWLAMTLIGTAFALIYVTSPNWAPRRKIGLITRALRAHGAETMNRLEREDPEAAQARARALQQDLNVRVYLLKEGAPPVSPWQPTAEMRALARRAQREDRVLRAAGSARDLYAVPLREAGHPGWVIVGELPQPERLRRYLQPETLPLRILVLVLVSGLICYVLARYLSRPIRSLQRATQRLAEGDLSARVEPALVSRRDETGDLGRDFDRMADRLQALLDAQQRLLRDISHELRSPLARLNVALELARKKGAAGGAPELDRIGKEAERLNDLVSQLTTLTRLESGAEPVAQEPIALDDLVEDIVQDSRFEGQPRQVEVALLRGPSAPAVLQGSAELLRRALENVVRNAVHATAPGTTVEVTLDRREPPAGGVPTEGEPTPDGEAGARPCALITVRDHGPGVPEEALADIFRPFYRVADARDRRTGGSGVGLSISQRAVTLHGGTITASNAPDGGLQVEITLPLSAAAHP